jgi:hypothetical protein
MSMVWSEANTPYSSGQLSLLTMSFFSYFAGPNGSNSVSDNNWGMHEGTGANRIYGLSYKTQYPLGDYRNLTYYYDNSAFKVDVNFVNQIGFPPPPPPPIDNDLNINVFLYDDSFTYNYMAGGGFVTAGGGNYNATISQTNDPIIYRGYWKVEIGAAPNFGGGNVNIDINGNAKVTGGTINAGPTPTSFDSNTYGTEDVAYYAGLGADGLYFNVYCY